MVLHHFRNFLLLQQQRPLSAASKLLRHKTTIGLLPRNIMTSSNKNQNNATSTMEQLPKLSQAEFQTYNRMASGMEQFHNMFRHDWNDIYASVNTSEDSYKDFPGSSAAKASASASASATKADKPAKCNYPPPSSKPLSQARLLRAISNFIRHLTAHHGIEEAHIFPHLATRMPVFQNSDLLKKQHAEIHKGLDKLDAYAKECLSGKRDLRREEVKVILDSFGEVLWQHLDQEVVELGAERMRRFWSLEEMQRMPF